MKATLSHGDFFTLIHSEDRDRYAATLDEYRARPGSAFRTEFRVAAGQGRWRWLELRATIVSEQEDVAVRLSWASGRYQSAQGQ